MRRDECSEQEQWVLEQLELGKIADLKNRFGDKEETAASGPGSWKLCSPMRLEGGPERLFSTTPSSRGRWISAADIGRQFSAEGAQFHKEHEANFNGLR